MNKQINSINGYSCVQVQVKKCNSMIFLLFTRAERSEACVMC